jgi:hypothetical protein
MLLVAYSKLISDEPAFDTVPARRRDSRRFLDTPASLLKDELLPLRLGLEKLFVV